jgi:serine/threonine protein kinase/Flp pilus assembly protein TadD
MVSSSGTSVSDASQLAPRLFITGSGAGGSEESPTPDPLIGQLLDGRYRVIERLAEGGMGTVYRAEHVALQKEVAIKLVQDAGNSDHALRFLREALLTSRIDHPNVISAIDYGTFEHGAAYLVMSLVEGPTLAQVMRSESPLSWARAGEIGAQIADAVAAAQAQGIVHRDLKPENVLLQPMANGTEVVKVLDFGIAKYARDSLVPPHVRGAQHVTQMGVVVGTPGYMAPEQAVGMRADHRADLYSIGVMLWECVAGRRLWDCDDVQQLLTAQLSSRPARLRVESGDPSIPEEFETLVAALLATRPENRPQTAIETRDRLRALVDAERRESQPRVELPPIAAPGPIVSTPPPNTDTVFIDAAVAGWRARSAGDAARDASPSSDVTDDLPTTRVLSPVAVHEAVLQPTTQAGFRGGSRISLEDAVLGASENVQPHTQPAHDAASVSAVESASEQVDAVGVKSRALRLYVTVPLTLAVVSGMVWAALALDSSRARSSATLRAREISTTARGAASHSGATQASPAQAEVASGTASDTHGTSRAPASQPAPARTVSQSASGARVFVGAKQNVMSIVARANSERELGDALRAKARTNFRHAEFELAAQTYRLAIKVSPGYAGSYAGLGASQLALGDARGAISSYKEAIRRAPGSSGFHAALGRAYLMTRDQARAVAEYRKAVALNPANDVAAKALARLTL